MQTIGEQLEEARKHKGISLAEASEATKIRGDFLQGIEQNEFNFDLPEIYKRGFVKNYANYLKLDTKTILADYDAKRLSEVSTSTRAGSSELFGSMDSDPNTDSEETSKPLLGTFSAYKRSDDIGENKKSNANTDKAHYLKIGLVAAGVLSFIFIVIGLIITVLNDGNELKTGIAEASPSATTPANELSSSTEEPRQETVSLIASGDVYVLIKQRNDNKELVRQTLSKGETLDFTKQGPVDILFTAGENLVIVNPAGERLKPRGEGTAKISIP